MGDSNTDSKPHHAVSLEHLFWIAAEDEDEAIENAQEKIAELDVEDVRKLDMSVVDREQF